MQRHENVHGASKDLRALTAADGYLQLGLPERALAELDAIETPGSLEAPIAYLRGEALKAQERFEDAIGPLQRAARLIPAPHNQPIWSSLVDCLRRVNHEDLAEVVEMVAEAQAAKPEPPVIEINVHIMPLPEDSEELGPDDGEV